MAIDTMMEATTRMITAGLVQNEPPYSEWMISSGAMVAGSIFCCYSKDSFYNDTSNHLTEFKLR